MADGHSGRTRDGALEIAWRPWHLISEGRVDEGLAFFDDSGTWWDLPSRADQPMTQMKAVVREILAIVPLRFELIDSIVEGNHVALIAEGYGPINEERPYRNSYIFVVELDPDRDNVIAIREYVDTLRASKSLMPGVMRAIEERGGESAVISLRGSRA